MLFSSIINLACLFAAEAQARYIKRADGLIISSKKLTARRAPSEIITTSTVSKLTRHPANSAMAARRQHLHKRSFPDGDTTTITALDMGEYFSTEVTFGTSTFEFWVDTGSSDTWVIEKGFKCEDVETGRSESESYCGFGSSGYTESSTWKTSTGLTFSTDYDSGEYLTGIIGTEDVSVAGIKINTEVGLVTTAGWYGDGTTSGLLGLAYPAITNAYKGTTQEEYNPIFTEMYSQGLIENDYFSLILERDQTGASGYLAFGGVPDISFTQNFTSTPIIVTNIKGYVKSYDFYTINIDSIEMNGKALSNSGGTDLEYMVDSGTTLNYVPSSVMKSIAAGYSPAATYSSYEGAYVVDCDAEPPVMSINIAGTAFPINPLDMINDAGSGTCVSSWSDGGSDSSDDLYILGDTFQHNVVMVFDVGAATMQFAERAYYSSDDTY